MYAIRSYYDAQLDALNAGQRLLVTTDRAEAGEVLKQVAGVTTVEPLTFEANRHCFALGAATPAADLAPKVAAVIAEKGWPLYGLCPETRSLERVFSEINSYNFV